MYIISILTLVVVITLMASFSGPGFILQLIDLPTIILLILITIPILFASGLLKDFGKSFQLVMTKRKETTLIQLKKSMEAVSLAIKTNYYASGLIVCIGLIQVFNIISESMEISALGANLAVAILPLAYVFAINLILLSIKYKLKLMCVNFTQD